MERRQVAMYVWQAAHDAASSWMWTTGFVLSFKYLNLRDIILRMEKNIDIDGLRLHYEEVGDPAAPPVILMHGWGCDHTTVKSIANILEPSMHIYNVDLPGHGKSQEPPEIWGVEEYTRLIEAFAKALNITKPSLIGHSFGGRVSILFSSRNDTEKVMLVDSAGIKPKRSLNYYRKVYTFKLLKRILLLIYGKEKGEKKVMEWRNKKGSADYRNSSPIMKGILSKCVNEDLRHVMPQIKAPVLLVWGDDDTATPLSDARLMESLIPDAGLVSFPGCGHYSFLDNPYGFKAVAKEFFKPPKKS